MAAPLDELARRVEDRATGRLASRGWAVLLAVCSMCGFAFVAGTTYAALRWEIRDMRETMNARFTRLEHRVEPLIVLANQDQKARIAEMGRDCALKRRGEQECLLLFRGESLGGSWFGDGAGGNH